jgi:dienelactone hydrolase
MRPGQRGQIHWRSVMQDVDEELWRRRLKLRSFRRPEDWQGHVAATRRRFLAALGPLPERTPLRVTEAGRLERDGYVVEKLLIETQPGFVAPAHLYLPERLRAPAPGVLNPVGHWAGGKAEPVEQARMIGLARRGYVALIWDPIGQGERSQFWDGDAPLINPSTYQHAEIGNPAFLIGSSVIAIMLWDGLCMLDYLCARPEVDAARIGCTGVSGGGVYTMFLGMVDRRITATVPVCSTATLERKHRQGQVAEPCQFPVRAYTDDLDVADLLMAHAPAALRIIGTRYDTFPLVGLREAFLDVQDCYTGLGVPEKTDLCVVDARHDYNQEQRELMYAWFNRWLDHDAPVAEDPHTLEDHATLWCTSTGHVLTSVGGKTGRDLVRELAHRVVPPSAAIDDEQAARREQERVRAAIAKVLGPIPPLNGEPPRALEPASVEGLPVERLILQARLDVLLPAHVFSPPGHAGHKSSDGGRLPAVILLDDRGKGPESGADGLGPMLARAGALTLAVDLRGWGETVWVNDTFAWSADRREPLSADTMLANVGLMLGRWSATQRVQDALGVLSYLRSRPDVDPQRIVLVGRGGGAIVALHAAAVDGGVVGVVAYEALISYRAIVEAPRHVHPVADFLPDVLLHYDLPDLTAALAPARVLIAAPQDAMGVPLPASDAEAAYAPARRTASLLGGDVAVQAAAGDEAPSAAREHLADWITTAGAGGACRPTPLAPLPEREGGTKAHQPQECGAGT